MTFSTLNTNLLNHNNLIFVGLVLSSSATTYLLGKTIYLGYKYYYYSNQVILIFHLQQIWLRRTMIQVLVHQ